MPDLYKGKKLRIRRAKIKNNKNYLEVAVPSVLEGNVFNPGDKVEPIFDHGILIYVGKGKEIADLKKLSALLDEVVTEKMVEEEEKEDE